MANIYTTSSTRFATAVRATGSTTYTGFEADRVRDWLNPSERAVATGNTSGTTYFAVDLGASTSVVAVFCDNINVDTIQWKYSTSASEPANAAAYTALGSSQSVTACPDSGRYKNILVSSVTARWIACVSGTATTTDSTGCFSVGSIVVVKSFDQAGWTVNPGFPFTREIVTPAIDDDAFGDRVQVGLPYARLTLASSLMPTSMTSTVFQLGQYGTTPMLFYLNDGTASEAYICRVAQQSVGVSRPGPNHISMGSTTLREVC